MPPSTMAYSELAYPLLLKFWKMVSDTVICWHDPTDYQYPSLLGFKNLRASSAACSASFHVKTQGL